MRTILIVVLAMITTTSYADFNPWSGSSHSTLKDATPKTTIPQTHRRVSTPVQRQHTPVRRHHVPQRQRAFSHGHGRHVHGASCGWVNGYWSSYNEQVWIPPSRLSKWIPQVYKYDEKGNVVVITPGYYIYKDVPGHYDTRTVTNWVSGRWACSRFTGWR